MEEEEKRSWWGIEEEEGKWERDGGVVMRWRRSERAY